MTIKELINILSKYSDAEREYIVQINSKHHNFGSENIGKIVLEDENNNTENFKGQVYLDLIGE